MIRDPKLDKRNQMVKYQIDLGKLSDMVAHRLSNVSSLDAEIIGKRLVSYVLKVSLDGGPLDDRTIADVYETINDLVHGGIIIPERYVE